MLGDEQAPVPRHQHQSYCAEYQEDPAGCLACHTEKDALRALWFVRAVYCGAEVFMNATAAQRVSHTMTTTTFTLDGYRILRTMGLVRGIIVRSRSVVGNFVAGLQTIVGGNISMYTELCEQTRNDAYDLMLQHAAAFGANAVVGVRYDATEIAAGVTEVLCYGTAVEVEKLV
jgi:uncharacterized protein YbjQ (UPF0145 family)